MNLTCRDCGASFPSERTPVMCRACGWRPAEDEPRAMYRATDPDTSQEAAERVMASGTAAGHREQILAVLEGRDGLISAEIGDELGLDNVRVTRRVSELVKAGRVVYGEPRQAPNGFKQQTIWLARKAEQITLLPQSPEGGRAA